jgi:hypothetical protein
LFSTLGQSLTKTGNVAKLAAGVQLSVVGVELALEVVAFDDRDGFLGVSDEFQWT